MPINSQFIARYIRLFLAMAGIDITTHFVRCASSSKAYNIGLSIKDKQKSSWLER